MGIALHIFGGIALVLATSYNVFLSVPVLVIYGFFWEKTQHRYVWSIQNEKLHREQAGWFGWITKHRLIEAAGWPIGGLIAASVWEFILT
jgi:hypothetical protein